MGGPRFPSVGCVATPCRRRRIRIAAVAFLLTAAGPSRLAYLGVNLSGAEFGVPDEFRRAYDPRQARLRLHLPDPGGNRCLRHAPASTSRGCRSRGSGCSRRPSGAFRPGVSGGAGRGGAGCGGAGDACDRGAGQPRLRVWRVDRHPGATPDGVYRRSVAAPGGRITGSQPDGHVRPDERTARPGAGRLAAFRPGRDRRHPRHGGAAGDPGAGHLLLARAAPG